MNAHFEFNGTPEFVLAAAAFVFFICFILYITGPWKKLAGQYAFRGNFKGTRIKGHDGAAIDSDWYMLHAGANRAKLYLTVHANDKGLHLRRFGIWGYIRASLFIPWADVSDTPFQPNVLGVNIVGEIEKIKGADAQQVLLGFKRTPDIQLQMPLFIAEKIKAASNGQWTPAGF
jgi:hypothetical protein